MLYRLSADSEVLLALAKAILPSGLWIGLLIVLGAVFLNSSNLIFPRERLDWSTSHMLDEVITIITTFIMGLKGLGILALFYLSFGLIARGSLKGLLAFCMIIGMLQSIELSVALLDGSKASKIAPRRIPNQAIRGSLKSFLLGIPFAGLIGIVSSCLLLISIFWPISLLALADLKRIIDLIGMENLLRILGILSLSLTMITCFIGFIGFGGAALFQHYLLRLLLWLSGLSPLNLPAWLEEISKTGLIVRFGGYYRFQHPSIQAALAKKRPASLNRKKL